MKMGGDTRTPGQEFRVAAAGPLVTLAIVVVAALFSAPLIGWDGFSTPRRSRAPPRSSAFELWLSFLVSMNVLLLVFNLVPASRSTAAGSPARPSGRSPATATGRRASSAYFGRPSPRC